LARRAFGLAAAGAVAVATALVLFGVANAIGGSDATSDNWVAVIVGVALLAGVLMSLAGFVLAVVAKVKHEPWLVLWLPLSMFPGVLAFLMLGEAFWWE
jgi:uncharacterized Tic20 family protein